MTSIALETAGSLQTPVGLLRAPKLRLSPARSAAPKRTHASTASDSSALRLFSRPTPQQRPVLIAGGDATAREALLRDLTQTMPQSTVFEQASAVWEVLARASDSSVVILGGELEDVSAEVLMQMLAHRHPGLPVVSLDSQDTPAAPAATSVAC